MSETIPILSLITAILAVFVGPLVSSYINKRQIKASLAIANNQLVAPMRQVWINDLRALLAELISNSHYYFIAGFENRTEAEYSKLNLLEHRIALMLNPAETDHKKLETAIRELVSLLHKGHPGNDGFPAVHGEVVKLSRLILKSEWNRVKAGVNVI